MKKLAYNMCMTCFFSLSNFRIMTVYRNICMITEKFQVTHIVVPFDNVMNDELTYLEEHRFIVTHEIASGEIIIRPVENNDMFCRGRHSLFLENAEGSIPPPTKKESCHENDSDNP